MKYYIQKSTGLTLGVDEANSNLIEQYEAYPECYEPCDGPKSPAQPKTKEK